MNDTVLFPAIQFSRDKSAQGFNSRSPVQFRSGAFGRQEICDLLCDRRFYRQLIHQNVEIRGNDAPTSLNPVHRQDGAQDLEVFLDPHHIALEIFPVISPLSIYPKSLSNQTSRFTSALSDSSLCIIYRAMKGYGQVFCIKEEIVISREYRDLSTGGDCTYQEVDL